MADAIWGLESSTDGDDFSNALYRNSGDPSACRSTANQLRRLRKALKHAYLTQDSHEDLPQDDLDGDVGRAFRHGAAKSKEAIWEIHNTVLILERSLRRIAADMDHVDDLLAQTLVAAPIEFLNSDMTKMVQNYDFDMTGDGAMDVLDALAAAGRLWRQANSYWYQAQMGYWSALCVSFDPGKSLVPPGDLPDTKLPDGEVPPTWPGIDTTTPDEPKDHPFNAPGSPDDPDAPSNPSAPTPPTGGPTGDPSGGPTGGGPTGGSPTGGGPHGHPHVPQHHEPELTQKERHQIQQEIKAQHHDVRQLQHRIDQLEQHPPAAGTPEAVTYHAEIRSLQSQIQMHNDQIATLEHTLHPHAGGHDGHPGSHGHRDHLVAGEVHQDLHLQATETPDAEALQPFATDPTDPTDAPSSADPSDGDDLTDGGDPPVHGTHPGQDQPVDAGSSAKDRLAARLEGREVTDATP